jgi:geranylgeranyl reductase family protein
MYDAIIVGAGPAGCAAASILSKEGYKVIILEKEKIPRYKCCAGGISLRCLNSLFLLHTDINEVSLQEYKGFALRYGNKIAEANLGRTIGWGVYRDDFDEYLAKSAIYNGARIANEKMLGFKEENGLIKVVSENTKRETKVLLAADGIRSIIRKKLGITYDKSKIGFCLDAEVKASQEKIDEFNDLLHLDFSYLNKGYAWIFPKNEAKTINIGIGGYLNSIQNLKTPIKDIFLNFQKSQNIKCNPKEITGALLPFGGTVECFGKDNVLLLGDAAGLGSPLDGEGIPYALESGIVAADSVIQHFDTNENLTEMYTDRIQPMKSEINEYAFALQQKIFGSNSHRKRIVEWCATNEYLIETLSKIFTHIISYEEGVKKLTFRKIITSSLLTH